MNNVSRKNYQAIQEAPLTGAGSQSGFFGVYKKKGKRSLTEMVKSQDNPLEQAQYALLRVEKIEGQIRKVLKAVSSEALRLVVARRPSLERYTR